MDPDRKRKIRLVVALSAAVLLAVGLVYTSFSASTDARQPSQVIAAAPGQTFQMTGKVVPDSIDRSDQALRFKITDREGSDVALPVTYTGQIPDPFREGREVIVTGAVQGGTFVAEHDSLITKCPSKFAEEAKADPEHVIITN